MKLNTVCSLSCGTIIIVGDELLIARPTYSDMWQVTKGSQESGESSLETAIRETKEESNIDLLPEQCIFDFGRQKYLICKDLQLFLFILKDKPTNLQCLSFFEDKHGNMVPEMKDFHWIKLSDYKQWVSKGLRNYIEQIYTLLVEKITTHNSQQEI